MALGYERHFVRTICLSILNVPRLDGFHKMRPRKHRVHNDGNSANIYEIERWNHHEASPANFLHQLWNLHH